MAGTNPSEILTATLIHRRRGIADAISHGNAVMNEMRSRGRVRTVSGGTHLRTTIMMGDENENFQWYTGREPLNVAEQEVLTAADFPWKQYACGVSISGLEMLQNSGAEQIHDMMRARIQHAEKTIVNQMHRAMHGDGTAAGGKTFGGLGLIVAPVAGATVGGIDSSTHAWWDNKRAATGGVSSASIYADMLDVLEMTKRGADRPTIIVSDSPYYSAFSQMLQSQQRHSDRRLASAGFPNVLFENIPVISDGGTDGIRPAGMKFLNLDSLELIMHRQRNNVVLGGPRRPLTEDSDTVIIAGMGNLVCNNRMLNGILTD